MAACRVSDVINGLPPQLLALTIQQEKPDLEMEKTRLLQQEEDKKIQLAMLEETLLEVRRCRGLWSLYGVVLHKQLPSRLPVPHPPRLWPQRRATSWKTRS